MRRAGTSGGFDEEECRRAGCSCCPGGGVVGARRESEPGAARGSAHARAAAGADEGRLRAGDGALAQGGSCGIPKLAAEQSRHGQLPLLAARSDQLDQHQVAGGQVAVPHQEHRLDADRRRRRDVRHDARTASSALDAATGKAIWTNATVGSGRGAAYGDGRIYVARDARVVALDAKTGELVTGFGEKGISNALTEVLKKRYPQLDKPAEWGYSFNMAPAVPRRHPHRRHGAQRESHSGRLVLAIDGSTGAAALEVLGRAAGP